MSSKGPSKGSTYLTSTSSLTVTCAPPCGSCRAIRLDPFLVSRLRLAPSSRSGAPSFGSLIWTCLLTNSTLSQTGRLRDQLAGKEPVPSPVPNGTQPIPAGRSSNRYKDKTRAAMASLHANANAGDIAANEPLATEDFEVVANGVTSTGRKAFAEIAAAINQG